MAIRLVNFADGFTSASSPTTGGSLTDPMTSIGDLIIRDSGNNTTRLAAGSDGYVLTISSGVPSWQEGGGDVSGPSPGSSTDNAIVRWDGTGGRTIQNGTPTISDAGVIAGLTGLTSSGTITLSSLTASRALTTNGSSELAVSATTSTELGYVSGVTSAIQTQLDARVVGPGSATDNAIARFDGTTGKLIQDSGLTIDDSGTLSGLASIELSKDGYFQSVIVDTNDTGLGGLIFGNGGQNAVNIAYSFGDDLLVLTNGQDTANTKFILGPNHFRLINTSSSTSVDLRFYEAGSVGGNEYVAFKAPNSLASSTTYTLPDDDGSSGEVLTTNGSGVLSWTGGAITTPGSSTDNAVVRWNGTGGDTIQDTTEMLLTDDGYFHGPDGAAATPTYSFVTDQDTGAFQATAGATSFSSNGTEVFRIGTTILSVNDTPIVASNGTDSDPSLTFASDQSTGFSRAGSNRINMIVGGDEIARVGASSLSIRDGYALELLDAGESHSIRLTAPALTASQTYALPATDATTGGEWLGSDTSGTLAFYNIASLSAMSTLDMSNDLLMFYDATDGAMKKYAPSNIDHDALTNFVANEHIDHTSVTLTAGTGLSGGGDISSNRTFNVDINGLTADGSPDGAADYVMTYDDSAGTLKKVLLDNLPGGGGGLSDVVDDTTPQLGGNLDVNGNSIVSTSNGDINITPNGTGSVVLDGLSWPQADGTADYVLKTDGAGQLSWTANTGSGLSDVVDDTSPQLGGNLDVNGNSIVSTSAGNITITPDTTGSIVLDGLSWPQSDGTADYVLKTNGAGQLSWTAQTGGTDLTGLGTDNRLTRWNGTDTVQSSGITVDDSDNVSGMGTLSVGSVTTSGDFIASLGAEATPSHTFSGDLNTGLWSSGADTLNFSTGGAERLELDSSELTATVPINTTDTTEATSSSTGAIITSGGISAAKNIIAGGQIGSALVAHGNTGATETFDFNNGNVHTATLDSSCTFTFSNGISGCSYVLILTQGSGGQTVTWPGTVVWPGGSAPTLSTGSADVDIVTFLYDGTNYYGNFQGDFT